jgi:hypothetical protein
MPRNAKFGTRCAPSHVVEFCRRPDRNTEAVAHPMSALSQIHPTAALLANYSLSVTVGDQATSSMVASLAESHKPIVGWHSPSKPANENGDRVSPIISGVSIWQAG